MTINRKTLISILAANVVVAIGCIAGMGWMYRAVRAYERANNVSILSPGGGNTARNDSQGMGGENAAQTTSKDDLASRLTLPDGASVAISADTNAVARAPQQMKVVNVSYDGETKLDVQLAERPEMDVVRRYVRVAPMDEGTVSFRYSAKYNHRADAFEPHLIVTGDFAFRTNITMVIRKGLPIYGKGLGRAGGKRDP